MFDVEPLVPAYGRDYKSIKQVQADFDAGKDFRTASGQHINKDDLKSMFPHLKQIRARFNKFTDTNFLIIQF